MATARPSDRTLKRLFAVSANRCAFPRCASAIVDEGTVVGRVCHIKAANLGGPRFDEDQTDEARHGFDNLILLCANHHAVIDDDEDAYTVDRLHAMKRAHEAGAKPMADSAAAAGAAAISIGQSGGINAQFVAVQNAHFYGDGGAPAWPRPAAPDSDLKERLHTVWWGSVCSWPAFRDLPAVVSKPSVLIHVTPHATALEGMPLDLVAVDAARRRLQGGGAATLGSTSSQWWAHGPTYRAAGHMPETAWATRFLRPGIVEWEINLARLVPGDERVLVRLEDVEDLVVRAMDRSLAFLEELGVGGPALASAVLYGMEVVDVPRPGQLSQRFPQQSFICPTVLIPRGELRSAARLKALFDAMWLEAGHPLGSPSFNAGGWTRYAQVEDLGGSSHGRRGQRGRPRD